MSTLDPPHPIGPPTALHRLAAVAKKVCPRFVWSPARNVLTAVLTPLRFSLQTGHFRSALGRKAVDRHGRPIPWYTYPAIDFLGTKDFAERTILEFGSGHSTLWWAKRAKSVVALESDRGWLEYVQKQLPPTARLLPVEEDLTGTEAGLGDRKFDVIIVDGLYRYHAAEKAAERITDDGVVVVDDSEGYWGGEKAGEYPILQLFRDRGFCRVDFYGFSPGVILPHCTSLFFKERSFIVRGENNVVRNKLPEG
jgi:hypothetical protein